MRAKVAEEDKAITIQRAKVKISQYNETFKNGLFNPICPSNYNFLTGYTDSKPESKELKLSANNSGKVNGKSYYSN